MHTRIRQYSILAICVLLTFGSLNMASAESTTVKSSGITFQDGTTQTTAASGGGSSVWSQLGDNIYYDKGNVGIGTTSPRQKLEVSGSGGASEGTDNTRIKITTTNSAGQAPGLELKNPANDGGEKVSKLIARDGYSFCFEYSEENVDNDDNRQMVLTTDGNVGIGTTAPGRRLHLQAPTYHPQFRLQDGNGSWELQGGENFHILNGTDGKDTNFFVANNGNVGIGTTSPAVRLSVSAADKSVAKLDLVSANKDTILELSSDDESIGEFSDFLKWSYGGIGLGVIRGDGYVGIGTTNPNFPLDMASGAHVTTGGVWTDASSRDFKENIRELTYDEAKLALTELTPSKFNYKVDKDDEYLGFIAEDVPDLVATKDRKGLSPMDIVAVLTKVVQKQQEIVERQQKEIDTLRTLVNSKR